MKNLVLMAVAIVAVSFASCGNKAADAQKATADSIFKADSVAALQVSEEAVVADDTLAVDSTATVVETATEAAN